MMKHSTVPGKEDQALLRARLLAVIHAAMSYERAESAKMNSFPMCACACVYVCMCIACVSIQHVSVDQISSKEQFLAIHEEDL